MYKATQALFSRRPQYARLFLSLFALLLFGCGGADNGADNGGGDGDSTDLASGFAQFDLGMDIGCGVTTGGELDCWSETDLEGFMRQAPDSGVRDVSVAAIHSCALHEGGTTVTCWDFGDSFEVLEEVSDELERIATESWTCGLAIDGQAYCTADELQPFGTQQMIDVAVGTTTICGVTAAQEIECPIFEWETPQGTQTPDIPAGPFNSVSLGKDFGCGLRPSGTVECFGSGDIAPDPSDTFVDISLDGMSARKGCGVTTAGSIKCWGEEIAELPESTSDFEKVRVGAYEVCGQKVDGSLECWSSY